MVTVGDAGTARGQTMPGSHHAPTFPLARPPATLQPLEGRRASGEGTAEGVSRRLSFCLVPLV